MVTAEESLRVYVTESRARHGPVTPRSESHAMRHSLRITLFSLTVGTLACIVPAHTQQPSSVLAGVPASGALFDTGHDRSLNKTRVQVFSYVGRSLGSRHARGLAVS